MDENLSDHREELDKRVKFMLADLSNTILELQKGRADETNDLLARIAALTPTEASWALKSYWRDFACAPNGSFVIQELASKASENHNSDFVKGAIKDMELDRSMRATDAMAGMKKGLAKAAAAIKVNETKTWHDPSSNPGGYDDTR